MIRALVSHSEKAAYFIKFNVDGLLRGDYQSRMNGYAIGRQNGWMSANDIRDLENLDRIPAEDGGDLYLINGNMTKLKDAGIFAGKEETQNEEVLELEDPDGDQSGDSGDGDGENTVPYCLFMNNSAIILSPGSTYENGIPEPYDAYGY